MTTRTVPYISLCEFHHRKDEIAKELIDSLKMLDFFILVDQESASKKDITDMFELSARYFAFPEEIKGKDPIPSSPSSLSPLVSLQTCSAKLMMKELWSELMESLAHMGFDCLTLLYQQDGGDGLEVCPGRDAHTSFARGDDWTLVPARTGESTINVGDMLMAWSEDRFKSLFQESVPLDQTTTKNRVSALGNSHLPPFFVYRTDRFCIRYFNQPRPCVLVDGPTHKYAAQTAKEYIVNAMHRNYLAAQQLKKEQQAAVMNTSAVVVA
ncbi:putative gibberellin 20-oxidase [Desarmillaria ectypa]|nr:putative gibberellin 20-oxidase [Desarmillaria ectypa]